MNRTRSKSSTKPTIPKSSQQKGAKSSVGNKRPSSGAAAVPVANKVARRDSQAIPSAKFGDTILMKSRPADVAKLQLDLLNAFNYEDDSGE